MDGYLLEHAIGQGGNYYYKVNHPTMSNNIIQMRSQQPAFRAGGNQSAFFLGLEGNNITSVNEYVPRRSFYLDTLEKLKK
jgi:hypothetical protein